MKATAQHMPSAKPPARTLLAISPHLDDAVLSCGSLLAGSGGATVVTVFAGLPPPDLPLTAWDRACGFRNGREAVEARRREDAAALAVLGSHPIWLECRDGQYGPTPPPEGLADAIRPAIARSVPAILAIPLGLYHPDHVAAADACLSLHREFPSMLWLAYEDVPYRRHVGWLQSRLARLLSIGIRATPLPQKHAHPLKAEAVACYASQLRTIGSGVDDASAPEGYWRLDWP